MRGKTRARGQTLPADDPGYQRHPKDRSVPCGRSAARLRSACPGSCRFCLQGGGRSARRERTQELAFTCAERRRTVAFRTGWPLVRAGRVDPSEPVPELVLDRGYGVITTAASRYVHANAITSDVLAILDWIETGIDDDWWDYPGVRRYEGD